MGSGEVFPLEGVGLEGAGGNSKPFPFSDGRPNNKGCPNGRFPDPSCEFLSENLSKNAVYLYIEEY